MSRRRILTFCALPECGRRVGTRAPHERGRPRRFCGVACRWRFDYCQWRKLGHELGIVSPRWACPRWVDCRICR